MEGLFAFVLVLTVLVHFVVFMDRFDRLLHRQACQWWREKHFYYRHTGVWLS